MTAPLGNEFDAFLFAPAGEDASGMPLTLLTLLARLDLDPWSEAANLAGLPRESATERLASLLEGPANKPESRADLVAAAARLVSLLHRSPKARAGPALPAGEELVRPPKAFRPAIYYLAVVIFLLICQWAVAITHAAADPAAGRNFTKDVPAEPAR